MFSLPNHPEIVFVHGGGDFAAISALRAARRSPEPHLSPSNSKGALSIDRSTLKGYRPLSGSGNRMETIQLNHPRLCDDEPCRLIGGSRKQGVRRKATMSTKCSSGAVPGGVLVTLPPWAKSLAARRRRNLPARNETALSLPPHPSGLTASHLPP